MYAIKMGPMTYSGYRDGSPFTLVGAMREVYGVGQAKILRSDGTVVVDNAGSSGYVTHVPSGRRLYRTR